MYDYMNNSNTKTVVVTGGSKGIGLDISLGFLEQGYSVFVGSRTTQRPNNLPESINYIPTDVRSEIDVINLMKCASEVTGNIDALVNNAGVSTWRPLSNIDPEFLANIFSTNLFSAFWACKAATKFMKKGASIINISSIAGKRGSSNNSAYVASKFGMNGLTQSLAKELGPRGIRVNGICPVLITTPGLIDALRSPDSPAYPSEPSQFIDKFTATNSALGRMPSGIDVAKMCIFLASSSSESITGQNINVDCGVFPQ